eukprot:SAG11_NODE_18257_length_496_cov_0.647355_1_plen_92_part_00
MSGHSTSIMGVSGMEAKRTICISSERRYYVGIRCASFPLQVVDGVELPSEPLRLAASGAAGRALIRTLRRLIETQLCVTHMCVTHPTDDVR